MTPQLFINYNTSLFIQQYYIHCEGFITMTPQLFINYNTSLFISQYYIHCEGFITMTPQLYLLITILHYSYNNTIFTVRVL